MRRRIAAAGVVAVLAVAATATAAAQNVQRFSDVPATHPAYDAVEWAAETGLTAGYGDGTFRPDVPLSKRHAMVFMERFYDQVLGADESEDFTRTDMMVLLHDMVDDTGDVDEEGLFGDPSDSTAVPPPRPASMWGAQVTDIGAEFTFQSSGSHSDRDLDKWPVRGHMKLICNSRPGQPGTSAWWVRFTIQGDANRHSEFEGLNVSLDNSPVRGLATHLPVATYADSGRPVNPQAAIAHKQWVVDDTKADAFMSWMVQGSTLKVTTRYLGEGVSFDVSDLRLYTAFLPGNCRW